MTSSYQPLQNPEDEEDNQFAPSDDSFGVIEEQLPQRICAQCGRTASTGEPKLLRCSRCKVVYYCNRECQVSHWKIHKLECAPAPVATTTTTTPSSSGPSSTKNNANHEPISSAEVADNIGTATNDSHEEEEGYNDHSDSAIETIPPPPFAKINSNIVNLTTPFFAFGKSQDNSFHIWVSISSSSHELPSQGSDSVHSRLVPLRILIVNNHRSATMRISTENSSVLALRNGVSRLMPKLFSEHELKSNSQFVALHPRVLEINGTDVSSIPSNQQQQRQIKNGDDDDTDVKILLGPSQYLVLEQHFDMLNVKHESEALKKCDRLIFTTELFINKTDNSSSSSSNNNNKGKERRSEEPKDDDNEEERRRGFDDYGFDDDDDDDEDSGEIVQAIAKFNLTAIRNHYNNNNNINSNTQARPLFEDEKYMHGFAVLVRERSSKVSTTEEDDSDDYEAGFEAIDIAALTLASLRSSIQEHFTNKNKNKNQSQNDANKINVKSITKWPQGVRIQRDQDLVDAEVCDGSRFEVVLG